jgi:hypothetical protein
MHKKAPVDLEDTGYSAPALPLQELSLGAFPAILFPGTRKKGGPVQRGERPARILIWLGSGLALIYGQDSIPGLPAPLTGKLGHTKTCLQSHSG